MIPYTTEPRADTRVTNVALGIWLFLASEVMLFGALFSSYVLLRVAAPAWPSGSVVLGSAIAIANTVVLFALTAVMWRARRQPAKRAKSALWSASALALLFLGLKALEYSSEISRGLLPATSTFLAMYFVLTGAHAVHVIGGVAANVWAAASAKAAGVSLTEGRVGALAWYWAFVDLVWMVIFVLVYLS